MIDMPHTAVTPEGPIPERRGGIVFSKDISLGNVITIVGMLVSVVLGYGRLETRITVLEAAELVREKNTAVDIAERTRQSVELKQDLRELRQDIKSLSSTVVQVNTQPRTKREAE